MSATPAPTQHRSGHERRQPGVVRRLYASAKELIQRDDVPPGSMARQRRGGTAALGGKVLAQLVTPASPGAASSSASTSSPSR